MSRLREEGHRIDVLARHGESADAGDQSPDTS